MVGAASRACRARLEKAVGIDPGNGDYRFRLGTVYNETGHFAEASRELARASRALPSNAKVWETLETRTSGGRPIQQARDAYRQAVQLDPKNFSVRNGFANALVRSGDPAAGLREFRRILESDPNNVRVQVNLGYAYIAAGDFQSAIKQLSAVTRNHPDDAGAHYDLGIAFKSIDDLPHARAELEQAIRLEPSLAEAHYSLALTYIDAGNPDQAIEQLRAAVAQQPGYNDAWCILRHHTKAAGRCGWGNRSFTPLGWVGRSERGRLGTILGCCCGKKAIRLERKKLSGRQPPSENLKRKRKRKIAAGNQEVGLTTKCQPLVRATLRAFSRTISALPIDRWC